MPGAGELLRRARESRRGAACAQARPEEPFRAAAARPEPPRFSERPPVAGSSMDDGSRPEFQPHHGAYSALMRSHDRMRTQHLPVQGGGNRA